MTFAFTTARAYQRAISRSTQNITFTHSTRHAGCTMKWSEVTSLGRVKWSPDPKGYAALQRELKHVGTAKA